ncbi:MAG: prepilin-type N-terminal cleavage/methylation domain-containing protein [Planctomycetes bacterium]|nr:prepilin-type N-terminal cleavage/methylation domain-containing protein [Planctomycetota bacterium]
MKHAFTLIELLVVILVISLLAAMLLPSLSRARQQARIVVVNAELAQIGLTLEMYMNENNGKSPPTRTDCNMGWEDHQLPPELVQGDYLPTPKSEGMTAGMEDRFNRGHTYKYWAVGELYQNNQYSHDRHSRLWVPTGFPNNNSPDGQWETDPGTSPVTWVVYSHGPKFDWWVMKQAKYPVPKETWYNPTTRSGIIVRLRLRKGRHIGSFERN